MIKLQYGQHTAQVPQNWDELNPKQLSRTIAILSQETNAITGQLAVVHMLLPHAFKKAMLKFTGLELAELLKNFSFLLEQPSLSTFKFTAIRPHWFSRKYYGPTNALANLSVREYGRAEFYLNKYASAQSSQDARAQEYLDKFIGCIYFKKENGDRYVPQSTGRFDSQIKKNALVLGGALKPAQKAAIAWNFSAVRNYVFAQFEDAFTKSEAKSKRDKYGWDGVVQHLAATRNMVPDSIYHMNLIELLIQLDTLAIANQEREEQQP